MRRHLFSFPTFAQGWRVWTEFNEKLRELISLCGRKSHVPQHSDAEGQEAEIVLKDYWEGRVAFTSSSSATRTSPEVAIIVGKITGSRLYLESISLDTLQGRGCTMRYESFSPSDARSY